MDYRNDLEASRLRISTLEAKLEESEASLKAREAELAESTAERDRLRKTGKAGPSRLRLFGFVSISFVVGTLFGASLGLHLSSSHEPSNVAIGTAEPQPEIAIEPVAVARGRAPVLPPESIPSSAIAVGQTAAETTEAKSIQSIVDDARPSVRECYQKETDKNVDAHGSLNVTFDIEPSGKVSRVELSGMLAISPHWWSKEFDACVVAVFRKLEFPASTGSSKTTAKGNYFLSALDRRRPERSFE